jgi:hypothetical protein
VDLDNLVRQQAKVGLINARGRLRQQTDGTSDSQAAGTIATYGQGFNPQQAQRVESSLGQADSENLELITRRILQTQAAAETSIAQIQVTMPIYGQVLRFDSPLQVEPAAEMAVAFTARPQRLAKVDPSLWYGFGLFGVLLVCGTAVNWTRCRWAVLCESLRKAPASAPRQAAPGPSSAPRRSGGHDDPDGPVSADELL